MDIDRRPRRGALSGERIRQDRPVLALHLDRTDLAEAELPVREPEGRLGDVDLARCRGLLQPGGGVHRVAHDPVLGGSAHRTCDHHAAVDTDPQAELDPELRLDPRGVLGEDLLHPDRAAERTLRIVLVGDRRAEDHEDRVADELLDRPVVPEGFLGEVFEDARDEHLELLRIEVLRKRGESNEVGEKHRHETALLVLRRGRRF